MAETIKTRQLPDKNARSCEVIVFKAGEAYRLAEGKAIVKTEEKSTILHTNKYKYPYVEKVYSVIICNLRRFYFEPTIDFLRDVERYDIRLVFVVDGKTDKEIVIHDAEPKKVDPTGEWEFALTEEEGKKIAQIRNRTTQVILY